MSFCPLLVPGPHRASACLAFPFPSTRHGLLGPAPKRLAWLKANPKGLAPHFKLLSADSGRPPGSPPLCPSLPLPHAFSLTPGPSLFPHPQQAKPSSWFTEKTRAFQRDLLTAHSRPLGFISPPVQWGSWPPTLLLGDIAPDLSLPSWVILIVIQTRWNISCQHLVSLTISSFACPSPCHVFLP